MFKMNCRGLFLSTARGALAAALGAVGFRTAANAQSATATRFPTARCCRRRRRLSRASSSRTSSRAQPGWPPTIMPPEGAPNVLLILIDDAGFGSNSAFGGVVPTPALDKLANARPALHPDAQHRALLADKGGACSRGETITASGSA